MDQVRLSSRYRYPKVPEVAAILALAPPEQPWRHEAPVRHRIRILLLLQGMPWGRADWIGHSLVARARIENGVRQPGGWDSIYDPHTWVITSCCPICDRPFRQRRSDHWFCSFACRCRAEFIRRQEGIDTRQLHCERCGDILIEPGHGKRFCSKSCLEREGFRRRHPNDDHVCQECGGPMPEASPTGREKRRTAKYCSTRCINAAFRRKAKLNGHTKPNGHDRHAPNGSKPDDRPNDAGGRERMLEDRAGTGGSEARAPRDDAAAGVAGS